jgi:Nitroreductase family
VQRIVDLLHHAEFEERHNPEGVAERAAWVTPQARRDGMPVASLGPLPEHANVAFRDLGNGGVSGRGTAAFEAAPTVAVLSTMHDRPLDWVRAGQALQRLLLVATNEGLVASFMNQPLEQDELRWQVRSPLIGLGHTQMLMRVGYGVAVPPTPRRAVVDVTRRLETAD